MIKIEQGVPIPGNITRKTKYPFREMKIGESFFLTDHEDPERTRKRVSAAATMFCANKDYKFKTQVFETGVRVWRIE
jgi:uncharacterized protein (DUF2249 family)